MQRREFLHWAGRAASAAALAPPTPESLRAAIPAAAATHGCDVFVYGSTAGGVAAAVEAARRGCTVILACPKTHPGGMPASGLSTTDVRQRELYGGFVTEFIRAVRDDYLRTLGESSPDWPLVKEGWFYEPRVAERVFEGFLAAQPTLRHWRGHHLASAAVAAGRVRSVELDAPDGHRVRVEARTFIDCTYEGDLAAAAGVPYRVGREGRAEHGESFAGVFYMDHKRTLQPLDVPGMGAPSHAIQAYCARSLFTTNPGNSVRIERPATYELHRPNLLPLLDDLAGGLRLRTIGAPLPGRKYQMNGQISLPTSINCPGVSWGWPEADRAHRATLERFHLDHAASYLWFLQHEPRVPAALREFWRAVALPRDEFADTGHWPWQIYVRQGRRIEGRALVTQHNFLFDPKQGRTPKVPHPIAVADYMFDVHPCQDRRSAIGGILEGVIWYPNRQGPARPGQVPFGAMLPRKLDNLLVPVALSSTHVGMSVLRMEPVWMTTGQVAGLAAAEAKVGGCDVAALDPAPLPARLGLNPDPWATGLVKS